ncbi:MAG: hypothetical protein AB8I69_20160, partial [Anaerolineae bacterium]
MKKYCLILLLTIVLAACVDQPTLAPVPTSTATPIILPTTVPSSGSSPTPLPPTPTATATSEPTATAMPPTATALPPTATPTPAPAAERIRFAPGATQAAVEGYLPADTTQRYVMHVAADQYIAMDATVGTTGGGLRFSIVGADGTVVKPMGDAHVQTVVPSTQDYFVELASDIGAVNYQMSVLIPVRIRFAAGATSTEVDGNLTAGGVRHYALH